MGYIMVHKNPDLGFLAAHDCGLGLQVLSKNSGYFGQVNRSVWMGR